MLPGHDGPAFLVLDHPTGVVGVEPRRGAGGEGGRPDAGFTARGPYPLGQGLHALGELLLVHAQPIADGRLVAVVHQYVLQGQPGLNGGGKVVQDISGRVLPVEIIPTAPARGDRPSAPSAHRLPQRLGIAFEQVEGGIPGGDHQPLREQALAGGDGHPVGEATGGERGEALPLIEHQPYLRELIGRGDEAQEQISPLASDHRCPFAGQLLAQGAVGEMAGQVGGAVHLHIRPVAGAPDEGGRPGLPAALVEAPSAGRPQLHRSPLGGVNEENRQLVELDGGLADVAHLQPRLDARPKGEVPVQPDLVVGPAEDDPLALDLVGHPAAQQAEASPLPLQAVAHLGRGPLQQGHSLEDHAQRGAPGVENEPISDEDFIAHGHGAPPPDLGRWPAANSSISFITSASSSSVASRQTMLVILRCSWRML